MMSRILIVAGVIAAVVIVGRAAGDDDLLLSNLNFDANDEPVLNFKSSFKKAKSSVKDVHSNVKSFARDLLFQDGCDTRPDIPINGNLSCSSDSGCRAACFEGYRFPHGETELVITCRKKLWKIQGADYVTVPHCEAICLPECKNNGICVAPNVCNCQENFSGPQCQFENKPCLNTPPMVMNAQRKCNSKTCTITCLEGFVFSDGSAVANLKCKHGNWVPTRKDWVNIPECKPVCSPACQNGGICLSLNVCQCPKDFRGPQCQYRANVCSGDKLGFNGGYSCNTIDEGSYGCELTCPEGAPFDSAPAARYVCRYETGVFEPQPIPQCQPQHGASLVQIKNEKSFFQSVVNRTWSLHGTSSIQQTRKSAVEIGMTGQYNVEGGSGGWVQTGGTVIGGAGMGEGQRLERKPEAGTCFTWNGAHYKTFDGQIYSFESNCAYTLVKDAQDGLFSVSIQNDPSCRNNVNTTSPSMCPRVIRIFIQGKEYTLAVNTAGLLEFRSPKKVLPIPSQLAHARVEATSGGRFIVVSLDAVGLSIKWDGAEMVQVEASEALWNRTAGLCGNMNGEREDDVTGGVMHPGTGWRIEDIGERCEEYPKHHKPCNANLDLQKEASEFCLNLLSDARYKSCNKLIDTAEFESTCRWDYCTCEHEDRRKCACETMGVYVRQCAHKGLVALAGWRDNNICPMECTNGKIYMSCGPRSQPSCGADLISSDFASSSDSSNDLGTNCEEGCFCPAGTVAYESRCITVDECPCRLRGKSFDSGAVVPKDCNTCVCAKGKWTCTESKCSARCSAVGDPHYTTFDGKRYDFMGKCSYYLVKGSNYSIEAENAACSSAISEMMGFARTFQDGEPACTKTVTVRLNGVAIKLKQNRQILVNGEDVTKLPMYAGGARLRIVSSIFIAVDLPNGLGVLWDGVSRVYVNAPPQFRGQTRGLCGTFTSGQKDDFLTPDGDVEQAVVPFANKWKTSEQCADVRKDTDHPCDLNPQKRAAAEKYCAVMKKKLFVGCHWFVDPEPFYKDCVFDMCACESNIETCLCPTLAAYAKDCAHLGVIVPWRQEVQECRVHCPGDQEYQVCGSSCTRSCADISFHHECKEECVEGCNCPKGYTLDVNGECIPIGQCPCTYGELEFLAGYREVRPGTKGQKLCTCAGGIWNCRLATPDEIRDYPAVTQLKSLCSATRHQEVTTCEPTKPRTCRNMHKGRPQHSPAICRPGCICKSGYVLDSTSGECVREEDCPCYHGGRSYKEGSVMQEECNTCTCSAGKWNCTDIVCAGVCSVWGDSHYKTFDDRHYDFQGVCDYVLAKGKLSDEECFDVTIRNVACGTTGVTCSKSITLTVGKTNSAKQESITLTRGKVLTPDDFRDLSRITARRAGLFVFLDVPDLGLVVQWDEGTRAYVRVDAKWKGRTKGLCGDYNDNARDDFKTPSGGMSEASANLFADSWKMSELCAEPNERPPDTCAQHPERKLWAVQKCRVMKSETFEPCHSEVEPEEFIDRCIYDTCGCDDGGDCECLCTAIAAYAHACNARGVPIKWRTQKMCPMQCDQSCSNYSPCVSTCPRETCDNLATRDESLHLCDQDTCIEGCQPKDCPEGYIYLNSSYSECVLRADCKTLCTVIDGVKYYEGDRVGGDDCHSCHCSRGKVVCTGSPCTTTMLMPSTTIRPPTVGTVPPSVVTVPPKDEPKECISGWTKWFNRDKPKSSGFRSDIEQLPSIIEMLEYEGSPFCEQDMIADIKCRTVDTKISYKDTGLNVECSVDNGFACIVDPEMKQTCPDFEISVLCRCDNTPIATQPPGTPGVSLSTSTPPSEGIYDECNLSEPYRLDEKNCHEFLQCSPSLQGNIWIRKSCDAQLMFNEKTQICDWPPMVTLDRPECIDAPVTPSGPPGLLCPSGQRWDDCAIECSRTCSYYKSQLVKYGYCNTPTNDQNCIPGCVPETRMDCSNTNYYWRDEVTCVERTDCMCVAEDGTAVAPGLLVHVSKCRSCQCLNNVMVCDDSACSTDSVTIEPPLNKTTDSGTQTIVSTSTPPRDCAEDDLVYLIEQSPFDVTYNASSYETVFITPDTIRLLHTSNNMVWRPAPNDSNPWIEIRFDRPKAVYGVVVAGDALDDSFVTSYKVKFSEDGRYFSDLIDDGKEPVLRGPADAKTLVRQMFRPPVEAKAVRLYPITKHKNIAMQVELIGCGEGQRVVTSTTTPKPPVITEKPPTPVCKDKMGYDNGQMSDQQVTTSSPSVYGSELNVHLSSPSVWRPHLDHQDQYVQFDFLEPRNLTGVKTKGGKGIWTTMYKVYYSNDGKVWNPVTDENRVAKQFLGNVDDHTSKVNYFTRPISARYLRVSPTKWHKHIGLKVEVIGCFVPYPPVTIPPTAPPLPLPSNCNICFGYPIESLDECKCKGSKWWDGQSCVKKADCPCYVGHVAYNVGTTYNTNDCQSCQCTLGGGSMCSPMKCPACSKSNERPVLTELCACLCKPCPVGERLCPTSGVCVAKNKWCDHVEDCPDDEIGCDYDISVKNTTTSTTTVNKTIAVQCEIDCPPGYVKQYENESYGVKATMKFVFTETITTSFKKEVFYKAKIPPPAKKGMFESRFGESDVDKMCPQFVCIKKVEEGEQCPKVECPENFRLVVDQSKGHRNKDCNNICVPIPPKERVCKVLGRIFTTFDDTQYKYDICNHILARDRYNNKWYIVAEKVCKDRSLSCLTTIQIHFDNHVVVLHPSMNVLFDGNVYTEREVKRLSENTLMKLSRVGNALRFESRLYPFWVMLEKNGDVKIGVSMIVDGDIDGMCGLMDGNKDNDKTKDDGTIAKNTHEFGDSWKLKDSAECKLMKCPEETSDEAWKMCSLIKDTTFAACDKVLNRETFFQSCIDSSCACLSSGNVTSRDCRCRALSSFVAECLARDRNIDLSGWRSAHECPAVCDAPFVHKDCFRNKCEMSCKNLQQADPCPMMDGLCVPGCFCPDGMVRNGDTCVPPSECRDCVCSGLGNSKYVTFDKDNLLFNGNCTYVLSRDIVNTPNGESVYQVLVSNGLCGRDICVEAITVLYESHVVQIRRDNQPHELMTVVNGKVVSQLPYSSSWLHLEETPSREIKLLIPSIQLEVISFKHDFTFMLRLPSHTFGGMMEGLCGDCDGNYNNDFKMYGGQLTKDAQEFGNSWLITDIPASLQLSTEHCFSTPPKRCTNKPSNDGVCERILRDEAFTRCHALIDPTPYYLACKDTLCQGADNSVCSNFEAYARMCSVSGICIDWRSRELCPYSCPSHLGYEACYSGCPDTCEALNNPAFRCLFGTPIEGCFCPPGYAWHNNSCVPRRNCFICDDEGHVEGDVWYPNKCTQCTCQSKRVKCQETSCPTKQPVCEVNATPVVVPGTQDDCCPQYLCVPNSNTDCVESQQPKCGFGQTLKVSVDANGCQKFICECVPEDQCATLSNEIESEAEVLMEPGYVQVIDKSGCCPKTARICKPETCPPPQMCQPYHVPVEKTAPNSCCPTFICEPPKDVCLYYVDSDNELVTEDKLLAKKIGEMWADGNCKTCVCELKDDVPTARCTMRECLSVTDHPDLTDFVLKETQAADQCCPNFERKACKFDGRTYKVNAKWRPNDQDACEEIECARDANGLLIKRTVRQECLQACELGYEYRPSADKAKSCCGDCVPVACVVNGTLKYAGESWQSEDYCTTSTCVLANGSLHVEMTSESCETIDPSEESNYKIKTQKVDGKCCPQIVRTACLSDGKYYKPGKSWKSSVDSCIFESCVKTAEGLIVKQKETKTCNTNCPQGWEYQAPVKGTCCGECQQIYCILDDVLYEPGKVWYSADNCTTYSCTQKNDQLLISTSSPVCPELNCAKDLIYNDGCCNKCKAVPPSQVEPICVAKAIDLKKTVGIIVEENPTHGICKNLKTIKQLTKCDGHCDSSTSFDFTTWSEIIDCKCCKPASYRSLTVILTCDDGEKIVKTLSVPKSCSCNECTPEAGPVKRFFNDETTEKIVKT